MIVFYGVFIGIIFCYSSLEKVYVLDETRVGIRMLGIFKFVQPE